MSRFITREKLDVLYDELEALGIDFLYLTDSEEHRNVNVKYLTGHPEDARDCHRQCCFGWGGRLSGIFQVARR